MRKTIYTSLILLLFGTLQAQDDLGAMLDESEEVAKLEKVSATFKGTRLINFHTCELAGKRTLDFRISHHFGDINSGYKDFYGLDGGATIRLALEYSYDGKLQFGLGRSNMGKTYDGFVKYKLMAQTKEKGMPLTITLFSGAYYNSGKDPNKDITGIDRYQYTSNRLAYATQIIFARKFSKSFSAQLAPVYVHYNLVDYKADNNDVFSLAFATRLKISNRTAFTFEYAKNLNKFSSVTKYYDSVGAGIEIETGGHVFSMYLTNSAGMIESQFIGRNTSTWKNGGIKLGFNISRVFTL